MADVKWIKIVVDIFDDEKILLIESLPDCDSIITIWLKLLCMAGKSNNHGVFLLNNKIAYTDEMLATIFRRPINTVRLALDTFENFGMIERVEGVITIPNWDKHQSLDALEAKKEYNRKRMAAKRAEQRAIADNSCCTVVAHDDNSCSTDDNSCATVVQLCDNCCSTDKNREEVEVEVEEIRIEEDKNNNSLSEVSIKEKGAGENPPEPDRQIDLSQMKKTYEFLIRNDLKRGDKDAANAHYKQARDLGIEIDTEEIKRSAT